VVVLVPLELIREFERQMTALRIGHTPLRRLQNMERKMGLRRLHVKLEGANPTGTHKDRMALLLAIDAMSKDFDTMTVATCGNYGAALAYICGKLDMKCRVYIPSDFEGARKDEIYALGGELVPVEGDYERAMNVAASEARANKWYDANPGGKNSEVCIYSYTHIAREIAQDLGRQPDWVSVPLGNGTVLAGVWQGFLTMKMKPRILGYANNNSAVRGIVTGAMVPVPVPDLTITHENEPLSGNFLADGQEAIDAIMASKGTAIEMPDEELVEAARLLMAEENLDILPASAGSVTAFAGIDARTNSLVAVATARGQSSPTDRSAHN
jgi:threonine synthase